MQQLPSRIIALKINFVPRAFWLETEKRPGNDLEDNLLLHH